MISSKFVCALRMRCSAGLEYFIRRTDGANWKNCSPRLSEIAHNSETRPLVNYLFSCVWVICECSLGSAKKDLGVVSLDVAASETRKPQKHSNGWRRFLNPTLARLFRQNQRQPLLNDTNYSEATRLSQILTCQVLY